MKGIVAVSQDGFIGKSGGLPWHYPEDLAYFKAMTLGCPVIMGRSTYESIGKPLPDRLNIVLSTDPEYTPKGLITTGVFTCTSPTVVKLLLKDKQDEAWVIGGLKTYEAFWDDIDFWSITRIPDVVNGDVEFPTDEIEKNFHFKTYTRSVTGLEYETWSRSH